ncbi:MAG TPA: HAD family phosphatase [Pseudonocardiaceae bacterium]
MTGRLPAGVLWDMDGTLVDSEKVWDTALSGLAAHLGGELSQQARLDMVGTNMAVSIGVLFDDLGLPPTQQAQAEALVWLAARAAALYAEPLPWRPGAAEALAMVRAAGIPCALVTNTERAITELGLESLGRHNFEAIVCGDEVPAPKPAPYPYRRAAELLGADPADCLAVEDSPTGVAAARAAGCPVLVVPCVLPVPPGEGRRLRDTLIGLRLDELRI